LDLFPTFAEISKQIKPKNIDGYSLLPFLSGGKANIPYERPFYFFKQNEQSVRKGAWFGIRPAPDKPLRLYLIEEDQGCERDVAMQYPSVVKELELVLNSSHINHPWYWNPGETQAIYNAKKKNAAETNQLIDEYRPNGMKLMPWEKKNNGEH
jgi:arylsulfatase